MPICQSWSANIDLNRFNFCPSRQLRTKLTLTLCSLLLSAVSTANDLPMANPES